MRSVQLQRPCQVRRLSRFSTGNLPSVRSERRASATAAPSNPGRHVVEFRQDGPRQHPLVRVSLERPPERHVVTGAAFQERQHAAAGGRVDRRDHDRRG